MLTNNLHDRWENYLRTRRDRHGNTRSDLLKRGTEQFQRMPLHARTALPQPAGPPVPTVFSGVSWVPIGPQPLRIDREQNFQGSGPDSGEVVDILIDPTLASDTVIYVATNNGGVWKTTDGGATWAPKTDFMKSLSMGAMAMDPVDHQIIYAGTGNNFDGGSQGIRADGIYRSIDAGETWEERGEAVLGKFRIIRIVVPAPDILLVATNNGLFRSVDGGKNFGNNAPAFDNGNPVRPNTHTDLAIDKATPSTIYACEQGVGIFVSTDGGVSFGANLFSAANGGPQPPKIDWISFGQSTHDETGAPNTKIFYALVTDANAANALNNLFRSTNSGANWGVAAGAQAAATDHTALQNEYDVTLAIDPLDSNRVYIGFQELYLSTDGGANFGIPAISANFTHFDNHALTFSPHPPAAGKITPFYTGTDGGVARNDDGNQKWVPLNETIATNLIIGFDIGRGSAANQAFTYGGCQDTGTAQHAATDAGNDWHSFTNGDGGRVIADPQNPKQAYTCRFIQAGEFAYFTTNDGGQNWNGATAAATGLPASTDPTQLTTAIGIPMAVDTNASAVVYVAVGAQLFRSKDTGATFTAIHTFPAPVSAFDTTKSDSKILMAGCDDGSVHRTSDADQATPNWTPITVNNSPGTPITDIAMNPDDNKRVVITYGGFSNAAAGNRSQRVFLSPDVTTTAFDDISGTDGAANPDDNVPDLPAHTVVWDHSTVPHSIIIGCDTNVLRSTDNGATWHIYGVGQPNADCSSLQADYSVKPPLIRLGTYGRSAFELKRLPGPRIFATPNFAFGDVANGSSADLTVDLFNAGDSTLTITDISDASSNPNFTLVNPPGMPFDIAPGGKSTITLRFAPTVPGKQIVLYSAHSNDGTRPLLSLPASGNTTFTGPQVTSLLPASGPAAGGTTVQIRGSGLTGATAANFGAALATIKSLDSDNQITVTSPPGSGAVIVTVTTPAGTTAANPNSNFTYTGVGTVITGLNPNQGPDSGGTAVVISGSGFTGVTQVLFGAFPATGITFQTDSQVTAVSPKGSGTVDVFVATPAGTSPVSAATKFTFVSSGGGIAGGAGGTGTIGGTGTTAAGGAENVVLEALADILRTGTDPDVLEAQKILLRRIALEGDVIDSRVSPPKNITEIGGYVNLLTRLGHTDIRTQMLASVLGVAGPATPVGLSGEGPAVAFINLPNDRPAGAAQPTLTTTISMRSDMADAFQRALQRIHGAGCMLPLSTPARVLPLATPGQALQLDLLQILGRAIQVPPSVVLVDPATDPVAIARLASDPPDRFQLVLRELDGGTLIAPSSWVAYQASDTNVSILPPASRQYLPAAGILADAGWYSSLPFATPLSITGQGSLPRLVNITGLVKGQSKLGDELLLLYSRTAVMTSALAGMLSWVWNGTNFVPAQTS